MGDDEPPKITETSWIRVRGARTHNLKNIDVDILEINLQLFQSIRSGKSSLAFDTLYAEGQRRYVESPFPAHDNSSAR